MVKQKNVNDTTNIAGFNIRLSDLFGLIIIMFFVLYLINPNLLYDITYGVYIAIFSSPTIIVVWIALFFIYQNVLYTKNKPVNTKDRQKAIRNKRLYKLMNLTYGAVSFFAVVAVAFYAVVSTFMESMSHLGDEG